MLSHATTMCEYRAPENNEMPENVHMEQEKVANSKVTISITIPQEYEVQSLSKMRKGARHPRYPNAYQSKVLVHWKGYDDTTWEPLENLIQDVREMAEKLVLQKWLVTLKELTIYKSKG